MKPILACIVCLALHCTCHAQKTYSIKGSVTDSLTAEVLLQASLTLIRIKDSMVQQRIVSEKNGFLFRRIPAGNYWLRTSHIGYAADTLSVELSGFDSVLNIKRVDLVKLADALLEVVVKAVIPPVIVKNDTLVYNANAFKMPPNATIEDLLKKLPGMAVDKNGNVTFHGRKVDRVFIDGKAFFLNDPKLATQNLTADMIDAVEAFDNQSERARFTGIKENNVSKAINLRLKKNKKKGLFGNASISGGTGKNFLGAATATMFAGNRWAFGSMTANYSDNLKEGSGQSQSFTNPNLNFRDNPGKNTMVVANYQADNNRSEAGQSTSRQTFLGDSSLLQKRQAFNNSRSSRHALTGNVNYNIDSFNAIVFIPTFNTEKNNSATSDSSSIIVQKQEGSHLANSGRTANALSSAGTNINNSLNFQRRFRKTGRTLYAVLSQGLQRQNQEGSIYSGIDFFDSTGANTDRTIIDQHYFQTNRGRNLGLNVSYTEPLGSNQVLDLGYNMGTSKNDAEKNSFNLNEVTGKYDLADTLTSNKFTNTNMQHNVNVGYNYLGKLVQYQLGVSMLYSRQRNKNENAGYPVIEQNLLNWSPRASALFRLASKKNLQFQYNGSSSPPTIQMLQPVPDLSNPFLINIGNPDLRQQFQHGVSMNYNAANLETFTNLSLQLGGTYTTNKIVQSTTVTPGGIQQLQYTNANGVYTFTSGMNYGFALNKSQNGNGQLSTTLAYDRDINLVNGKENRARQFSAGQGVSVNYRAGDRLYAGVGANFTYRRSEYSIGANLQTEVLSQIYNSNITYTLFWRIRISSDFSLQADGKQGSLPARTLALWNASLYRDIFKNKMGQFGFSAFDLLNNNNGFNRTLGDNYIETTQNQVLKRNYTLSLRYNFRGKPV